MSLEALWTIQFGVVGGWQNGGVAVLESGRVFGGDSQYYYMGTFDANGDNVIGDVRVVHYSGPVSTAFGTNARDFKVRVEVRKQGEQMTGNMYRIEAPNQKLPIRFTRKSDLP